MPSSCGGWGSTPEWAITGRVPSAFSSARFTDRSRTVLFQVGSSCATNALAAMRRSGLGVAPHRGVVLDGHRLVVAAPDGDRRVVAEQVDRRRRPGALPACGRRGRSPTAAASPARAAGRPRRRRRTARAGVMWAWTRSRSSPASPASATSPASSSGVASARAMRVGPWFEPLRNSRSPLTLATHARIRTWRSPVRQPALVGRGAALGRVEHHGARAGRAASARPGPAATTAPGGRR